MLQRSQCCPGALIAHMGGAPKEIRMHKCEAQVYPVRGHSAPVASTQETLQNGFVPQFRQRQ